MEKRAPAPRRTPARRRGALLAATLTLVLCGTSPGAQGRTRPGEPILYQPIYPALWNAAGASREYYPWVGERVTLLTTHTDLDRPDVRRFLARLDAGWESFEELSPARPRPYLTCEGKPTIACLPPGSERLTCGEGCSFPGVTGIEVLGFYDRDLPELAADARVFRPYYFHEMARNFFVYGDRHSLFQTGFAVFLRYVTMDRLKLKDPLSELRDAIEGLEARYAASTLPWVEAFTGEGDRLEDVRPSDPTVLYGSIQLALRRRHGGDRWVERFLAELMRCPEHPWDTPEGVLGQAESWAAAACVAARRDLCDELVGRWRFPLRPELVAVLGSTRYDRETHAEALLEASRR